MGFIIPAATTAISLAANIWGQSEANKAEKQAELYNQQRMNNLGGWFNKEYYQNYLDSATSRAALSRMQASMKEAGKNLSNSAVAGGATPEALVAQQGKMQLAYNQGVNNLVEAGDQRRNQVQFQYQNLMQPLENTQQNILNQKIAQWGNFAKNIGGAGSDIMKAWTSGAFDKNVPPNTTVPETSIG